MSKFANAPARAPRSPMRSTAPARTHQGGAGFTVTAETELFRTCVSAFAGGEGSFYQTGADRDSRLVRLVHEVAATNPSWIADFVPFLRDVVGMRSAPVVIACEYAAAARPDGAPSARGVVSSAIRRADEPGEVLGYWRAVHGRSLPASVKRGVADAVARVYTERSAIKWDGVNRTYRFGDVIKIVHPAPTGDDEATAYTRRLWRYLIASRKGPVEQGAPTGLPLLDRMGVLNRLPVDERRGWLFMDGGEYLFDAPSGATPPEKLRRVSATWEWLAGWLPGGMDAAAWTAIVPSMGYTALLRNLRNFELAGLGEAMLTWVADKLADPEQVIRSMEFPYQFWTAHRETAGSMRWGRTLSSALDSSCANIPELPGRSLVLVDTSASMETSLSNKGSTSRLEAAAVFAAALARRNADSIDVVLWATGSETFPVHRTEAVVATVERMVGRSGHVGHGTLLEQGLRHYAGQNRVFVFSDEQVARRIEPHLIPNVPVYAFDLGGYGRTALNLGAGGVVGLGGLSDVTFKLVPLIEAGRDADWSTLFGVR